MKLTYVPIDEQDFVVQSLFQLLELIINVSYDIMSIIESMSSMTIKYSKVIFY